MKSSVVNRDLDILGGAPVFVGTRVPIRILKEHLEAGDSLEDFLDQFPSVRREQAVQLMVETSERTASMIHEAAPR